MAYRNIRTHQIRAARSLLDWTQEGLADRCGISKFSVANMEGGKRGSHEGTISKVIQALELAGIEFIDNGVRLNSDSIVVIEGDNWFMTLLDDVHNTLLESSNKELLVEFADEDQSPPEVMKKVSAMRKDGIVMRFLISDEVTVLAGPRNEYRCIPKKLFTNYVSMIYANKMAVCTDNNIRAVVIKDPLLAQTRKNMFELAWSLLEVPSGANVRENQNYE